MGGIMDKLTERHSAKTDDREIAGMVGPAITAPAHRDVDHAALANSPKCLIAAMEYAW